MKRALMAAAVVLAQAGWVAAAESPADVRRPGEAPRLLAEALRKGTAEPEAIGAIVRWVLEAKEETVAAGLVEALGAVALSEEGPAASPEDERWRAAARSAVTVLQNVLRDAEAHRRRDPESVLRDLAPVIDAVAPGLCDPNRDR
jgi:hypothetical protein